jgi:hypothetical protein
LRNKKFTFISTLLYIQSGIQYTVYQFKWHLMVLFLFKYRCGSNRKRALSARVAKMFFLMPCFVAKYSSWHNILQCHIHMEWQEGILSKIESNFWSLNCILKISDRYNLRSTIEDIIICKHRWASFPQKATVTSLSLLTKSKRWHRSRYLPPPKKKNLK